MDKTRVNMAIAMAVGLAALPIGAPVQAAASVEMCYGVAAAGQNDCATTAHYCAGETKVDRDPASWITLPVGACLKIAGGSLKPG